MKLKVRTHPIAVYYVTGQDAAIVRESAGAEGTAPCFCTESFGDDGFAWRTAEEFEEDYQMSFGKFNDPPQRVASSKTWANRGNFIYSNK